MADESDHRTSFKHKSFKNPMAGGMLEYDDTFNEMLAEDRKRCRCTIGAGIRFFIILPTVSHWVRYVAATHTTVNVTDSEGSVHPIYMSYTHQFVVSTDALTMPSTAFIG